jgi:hypothetical protein
LKRQAKRTGFLAPVITTVSLVLSGLLFGLMGCPLLRMIKDPNWSNLAQLPPVVLALGAIFLWLVSFNSFRGHEDQLLLAAEDQGYDLGYKDGVLKGRQEALDELHDDE